MMLHLRYAIGLTLASAMALEGAELIPLDSNWQFLRGTAEASSPDPATWRTVGFNDDGWATEPAPFWYGEVQPSPGTELSDMRYSYTCAFLRKSIFLQNPNDISELELGAQSDDGFIAWINGHEVARFNMPTGDIPYDGASLSALPEPIPFQTFDIPNPHEVLVSGENVLAIQGFNSSRDNSSDFVLNASLTARVDNAAPFVAELIPPAGALVPSLSRIEVIFNEPVTGVDATDLLINDAPATDVTPVSMFHYVFTFPDAPVGTVTVQWIAGHGIRDLATTPNAFGGGNWSYTVDPDFTPPPLLLNEFMADNDRTLNDAFGEDSDWIEIYNPRTEPASLSGWYLTDTTSNLPKWAFPPVTIEAGGYLLVFASERDLANVTGQLHTNFRLAKEGGYLGLIDPGLNIIDDFYPGYPGQETDISYGHDQSNPNLLGYFAQPTPGGPNSVGGPGSGFAPEVVFSHPPGTFTGVLDLGLSLETPSPAAVIRYTLNGNPVTESSTAYTAPIRISTTTQVRVQVYQDGLLPSAPRTAIYIALAADVLNFTSDLPLVILHNGGAGSVPASSDQPVMLETFEPVYGVSSLTNRPDLTSRAIFHLRGSSTLYYSKGSFFLETQDEVGNGRNGSLLGLPAESDWVLYAPNNFEPVLLNNAVAHELSRQMGQYSPRTRFCVVFLNTSGGAVSAANYNGIYLLEEKIKVDRNRVDVDKLQPEHVNPPEVTGGYLLSQDRSDPGRPSFSAGGQPSLNYLSPSYEEIVTPQRDPQQQYINSYLNQLYSVLTGPNWTDPETGYAAYIDIPAALDHHIQGIVTFNVDALRLSGFFRKARSGKIIMGPVWDFDRTQGSTDGRDFNPRTWRSNIPDYGTDMFNSAGIYSNPWYSRMFRDIDFWQQWIDRYQELRDSVLTDANVHLVIDTFANQVRQEQPREVNRWGVRPRSGTRSNDGYSYTFSGTYQGEVDWVKHWYSDRLEFLDGNFLDRPRSSQPEGPIAAGTRITLSGPAGATLYYTLNGVDPRAPGGNLAAGAQTYTGSIVLNSNARLMARARNLAHSNPTGANLPPLTSPWSGLTAATYVVATPALVISEIMYHPAPPPAGNTNAADNFEFIELLNRGSTSLDLVGARFTNGIQFAFTTTNAVTTLAPDERLVLVRNRAAFTSRYPAVTKIAGEYLGSLDNAGERIALIGPLREPIHDFEFNDAWYRATDGHGFSLVIRNESATLSSWTNAAAWSASALEGGSPGVPEPAVPAIAAVVVNEALTHTDPPEVDSVELHNPTSQAVDLSGWLLTDDPDVPDKFRLPAGTVLDPGDFVVFTETEFTNSVPGDFRLSSLGEDVYLFSTDGTTNLTGYVHGFEYGAARNGVAFGRHLTSDGRELLVAQRRNTLGQANAGPKVGPVVIHEIMFHPPPFQGTNNNTRDEYVELHNLTAQPVPLFDPDAVTNTWRIRGGVDFNFPTNVVLPAGGYLLLVDFDPIARPDILTTFRNRYGLDPATVIYGPYSSALGNSGERVSLYQPDPPQTAASPIPGYVPYVLVDEVHYAASSPWPTNASATGKSLQRRTPSAFGDDPANWQSADPTPAAQNPGSGSIDNDNDGLPNDWELDYGLDPNDATGENGALGDPDGDGLTNEQEWLCGTAPNDSSSYLKVDSVSRDGTTLEIRFQGVAGRTYTVLYRETLFTGGWLRLEDMDVTQDGEQVVSDPASSDGQRFYRLVTPRLP